MNIQGTHEGRVGIAIRTPYCNKNTTAEGSKVANPLEVGQFHDHAGEVRCIMQGGGYWTSTDSS